jgi:hypothetical protein
MGRLRLLPGEYSRWYHAIVPRSLSILGIVFLIATIHDRRMFVQPTAEENPTSWTLDLKTLGYPTHPNRAYMERFGIEIPKLAFADSDHLVLTFLSADPVDPPVGPDGARSLALNLHAIVLDSKSGKTQFKRDWPNPNMNDGVVASHNARIVIHRGDLLTLLTTSLEFVKELDISPTRRPSVGGISRLFTSPTGRFVLLDSLRNNGWGFAWIDTENLQTIRTFFDQILTLSISDEEIVAWGSTKSEVDVLVIGKPEEARRIIPIPRHHPSEVRFINSDCLAIMDGNASIRLVRGDGTPIETIKPPARYFFGRATPSADGKRFVFTGSSYWNDLETPSSYKQHESVMRVMVYDLPTHQFICNLKVGHSGRNESFPLALSPDGSLLAFFDGAILKVYRLPPASLPTTGSSN